MTKLKGFKLLNLDNLQAKLEKNLYERFQVNNESIFTGEIVYSRIFHQYLKQNKTSYLPFSVQRSFIIAKHSKCILSFMGASDFKIFMFENSQNKAQISEKVPTLHKSRYLKNSLTVLFVKL